MSLDVLIPHHRDLQGLALSLGSVRDQTWTGDIRIVVVDDGSPTKEFRAAKALLEDQPFPFVIQRNPENRGRPYTRNRLLDGIESEYVAWLDAGDIWYPEKLARQFAHIHRLRFAGEDLNRIWVTCDYDWQREGARRYVVKQETEGDQLKELFLGEKLRAYLWTLLAPTSTVRAVGRFDEQLPRLQDLDYFIRFVRAGGIITNVPQRGPLCLYQKSDLGRSAHEIRSCNQRIFAKHRTSFESYGREFISTARYNAERLSARYAKHNGNTLGRIYYIAKAFAARPRLAFGLARRWVARFGHGPVRLHVLAGCCELLQPRILTPEEADSLIGPCVRTALASWLSPSPDSHYHAVLQEEPGDRRTAVMALALKEEFGVRFEPLLVLPELLDEIEVRDEGSLPVAGGRRSQLAVLSEIQARGHLRQVRLYGLGLPDEADPEKSWAVPAGIVSSVVHDRIEKLRTTSSAETGSEAVEARMIEATPDLPVFGVLYSNAICNQIARRLLPRLREHGWTSDDRILPRAIGGIIDDWGKSGISPSLPLRADDLDAMTNLVFEKLF